MVHNLSITDIADADRHMLEVISKQVGNQLFQTMTDDEIRYRLMAFISRLVDLNQKKDGLKPGSRVATHFTELGDDGRVRSSKRVEGEYVGVWNGFVHMKCKTADLPTRFYDGSEHQLIRLSFNPDEILSSPRFTVVDEILVFGRGEQLSRKNGYAWVPMHWSQYTISETKQFIDTEYPDDDVVIWEAGHLKAIRVNASWAIF